MRIDPTHSVTTGSAGLGDHAPLPLFAAGTDGVIVQANNAFFTWSGYSREEVLHAMSFQDLLSAGGKVFYAMHHIPLVHLQGAAREVAYEVNLRGRKSVPVLVSTTMTTEGGKSIYYFAVTELVLRKKYESGLQRGRRDAEDAAREKEEFLSTLSHEIRNPMTALQGAAQLLAETALTPEQSELLRAITTSSRYLMELSNDVLNINKVRGGKATVFEYPCDLRKTITDVGVMFTQLAVRKGIRIRYRADAGLPPLLLADEMKVRQVLCNLVGNAVKFTARGGITIRLSSQAMAGQQVRVRVTVRDTGIGIGADKLKHLFRPFAQADASVESNFGGSGMGLAISRELLALYQAPLEVKGHDRGTAFSFSLVLRVPAETSSTARSETGTRPRILITDDHETTRMILSAMLAETGAEVDQASTAREAWTRLHEKEYDLMLLDFNLPDLGGPELLAMLRHHSSAKLNRLPVVAISGDDTLNYEMLMATEGLSDYLIKPVDKADLIRLAARYTRRRAPRQPLKISFGKIKSVAGTNVPDYIAVLAKSVDVLRKEKLGFAAAFRENNPGRIRALIHKTKTMLHYFEASAFLRDLEEISRNISEGRSDEQFLVTASSVVGDQIDEMIDAISREREAAVTTSKGRP